MGHEAVELGAKKSTSEDGEESSWPINGEEGAVVGVSSHGAKGTWKHAAFHVATTIATPAAYAPLPFAMASLSWPLGVCCLVGGTFATWYSSLLIASLWEWNGKKQTTYRELGRSIYGSWGYWSITVFQQVASLGNNIAIQIVAGSSLKVSVTDGQFTNIIMRMAAVDQPSVYDSTSEQVAENFST